MFIEIREPPLLGIIADVGTMVSFGWTLTVFFYLRSVKKVFLAKLRIPEGIADLERQIEVLRTSLRGWPNSRREANEAVHRIDGVLINVIPKLVGAERRKVNEAHALIRGRKSIWRRLSPLAENKEHDEMWEIFDAVAGAISVLQQVKKDNGKRI